MAFSREDLKAMSAPKVVEVEIKELGGTVHVLKMSGKTLGKLLEFRNKGSESGAAFLVASSLCDEGGKLFYDPSCEADVDEVNDLPATAIKELVEAINSLNGWNEVEEKKAD
jgi:hypothetical protein